ncbi:MAG: TIGR02594 family protein [Pseudolabrys sp.]|nr:TIGR02594 family protein [Pseudolabrys sp.]
MASAQDSRSPDAQPYPTEGVQPAAGKVTKSRGQHGRVGHTGDAFGGLTSNSLVSEARRYLGTNPTGRGRQWCGAFMDLVLKKTGHTGGGNLAIAYARYGTRVSGPQVGAIAVMNHHVGVVSGIDPNGNPIIVSGNHNRTVAESVYPRSRIAAYVMPGS